MGYLNESIPEFYCLLRKEYLYNLTKHQGEFEEVCVFGIASIPGRSLMFHSMTCRGAQIARMPICAFAHKEEAPVMPVDHLELWDCFSYYVSVHAFEYLKNMRCRVLSKNRCIYKGTYLFTVDWCQTPDAELPGEGGHKNAHIIRLDNGCFAAQPNNRIFWYEPAFVTTPFKNGEKPDYITMNHTWTCENENKWVTENSEAMFYDTHPLEDVVAKEQKKVAKKRKIRYGEKKQKKI